MSIKQKHILVRQKNSKMELFKDLVKNPTLTFFFFQRSYHSVTRSHWQVFIQSIFQFRFPDVLQTDVAW